MKAFWYRYALNMLVGTLLGGLTVWYVLVHDVIS